MNEIESHPEALDVRDTANRLRIAISAFKRRAREVAAEGDLSNPQLTALSRLDRFGPMTTTALARREQITPQAMGTTIASLEQLGLITRSTDTQDARRSILNLTPEGQSAIRSGRNAVVDKVAALLKDSFTDSEIETLFAAAPLIERLAEQL